MNPSEIPEGKCGYVYSLEDTDVSTDFPREKLKFETSRSFCCWRDATYDDGRCVLHSDLGDTPNELIQKAISEPDQRTEGMRISNSDTFAQLSLQDCRLEGVDLSGLNLVGQEIKGDVINSCDFSNSNLRSTSFTCTKIINTDFTECNLTNATFDLEDVLSGTFQEANLRGVSFNTRYNVSPTVDFTGADFSDTDLPNIQLRNCKAANFRNADLTSANLSRADVRGANFENISGKYIDLWKADLTGADFKGAYLSGGNFGHNDFTESDLEDANFSKARLERVDMHRMDLQDTKLSGADLSGANLSETKLRGSDLSNSTLRHANLTNAELYRADISDAYSEYANFGGADIRRANFNGTHIYQALLTDARVNEFTSFDYPSIYEKDGYAPYDSPADSYDAATWVYRSLSRLYEDNAMAEQARQYHIRKEDIQRKAHWDSWNNFEEVDQLQDVVHEWNLPKALIYEVNHWTSRHGESPYRVVGLSLLTVLFSAFLFPFAGIKSNDGGTISWANAIDTSNGFLNVTDNLLTVLGESIYFSTVTFTTLSYGDLRPLGWAKALATVESFIGALLLALLVFVLGRRASW